MIKRILALTLLVTTMFVSSCKKDEAIVETGTIRYSNTDDNDRYEIFLDGASLGLVNVNTDFDKVAVPVGSHIVKAVQQDGVVISPISREQTLSVTKGTVVTFSFP